jgi:hypothetical protein
MNETGSPAKAALTTDSNRVQACCSAAVAPNSTSPTTRTRGAPVPRARRTVRWQEARARAGERYHSIGSMNRTCDELDGPRHSRISAALWGRVTT